MYKKVSALALAAVMTLSLVGCGSSASSSSAAASQPASSAPASSASSEAASTPATGEKAPRPEGFPSKDITYIYPFGAGSGNDVYFRLLAEKVRQMEGWDKTFVVEYMDRHRQCRAGRLYHRLLSHGHADCGCGYGSPLWHRGH